MNIAFSCELFSKAILYNQKVQGEVKGHKLSELYAQFPIDVKKDIKEQHQYTEERFKDFLNDISEEFSYWRYRFEYKCNNSHYSFVFEYANMLYKVSKVLLYR